MANDLLKNPWKVDTAAATVLTTAALRVRGVRWVGATTAGHTAIIHDQNARVVWSGVATGANYAESDMINTGDRGWDWDGLIVPTLASGILYIELL